MGKFKGLLRQFEFHILALIVGFLFLSWPLVGIFEHKHPGIVPACLFLVWTILIALLILIACSIRAIGNEGTE